MTSEISCAGEPTIEQIFEVAGFLAVFLRDAGGSPARPAAPLRLSRGASSATIAASAWLEAGEDGTWLAVTVAPAGPESGAAIEAGFGADGTEPTLKVTPRRIASPQDLAALPGRKLVARGLQAAGAPVLARIVAAAIAAEPAEALGAHAVERLVQAGAGRFAEGWTLDAGRHFLAACSPDLRQWALPPAFATRPRPDIAERLEGEARGGEAQGFAFVLAAAPAEAGAFYLVELAAGGRQAVFHGPLRRPVEADETLALEGARLAFGEIAALAPAGIDAVYRPLLSLPREEPRARRLDFGPRRRAGAPLASILMPLYGDAFFLNCAFHLQRVLDERFELVLAVDDPRIWPEIRRAVAARSREIRLPTVLLGHFGNYGFGRANNLAARAAAGDVLILMNSDVLVDGPDALAAAAEAIRARKPGEAPLIVGFSLLYEDDTIQHVGMTFERSAAVGNLFLSEHPHKGLPFALDTGPARAPARAVTAALMALPAALFQALGGFDPAFERGDFEDADLCLRARALGAEIELHRHAGLYHLERQSIALMGGASLREMVTYMNCVEFNRRWSRDLSGVRLRHRKEAAA